MQRGKGGEGEEGGMQPGRKKVIIAIQKHQFYTGIMIGKITMAIENYKYFQYYSHQYF